MTATKREKVHNPADDYGVEVKPTRVIKDGAGWLRCPDNKGAYSSGRNEPWRR